MRFFLKPDQVVGQARGSWWGRAGSQKKKNCDRWRRSLTSSSPPPFASSSRVPPPPPPSSSSSSSCCFCRSTSLFGSQRSCRSFCRGCGIFSLVSSRLPLVDPTLGVTRAGEGYRRRRAEGERKGEGGLGVTKVPFRQDGVLLLHRASNRNRHEDGIMDIKGLKGLPWLRLLIHGLPNSRRPVFSSFTNQACHVALGENKPDSPPLPLHIPYQHPNPCRDFLTPQQHAHVPKFGNWDGDGNVPYTQYFDSARKGRNVGKFINPNDPQQNPSAFPEGASVPHASPLRNASEPEILKHRNEQHTSKEDNYHHRHSNSPAHNDAAGCKPGTDASNQQHGEWVNINDHKRTSRGNSGSERSFDRSPLHSHYQVKSSSKGGVSSPARERKTSLESGHGFAPSPNTQGRSKLRMADGGDQTADKGSTVPKFGDWDEKNPSSADGFTHIFNKVREEKQVGAGKAPIIKTDPVFYNDPRQEGDSYGSSVRMLMLRLVQKTMSVLVEVLTNMMLVTVDTLEEVIHVMELWKRMRPAPRAQPTPDNKHLAAGARRPTLGSRVRPRPPDVGRRPSNTGVDDRSSAVDCLTPNADRQTSVPGRRISNIEY
ncbi:hypothetical protein Taro_033842 [Colocasia esculenta]|uniref:RIN4 pathogenic type III effector avirulence factor Avr cleavage site domain-containing protein n=1 Tax=Colocasia esculenta TaxID=4460 RepID=A0A843W5V6_COLES|nr:hypothetical protein [Colocasia esculenta]